MKKIHIFSIFIGLALLQLAVPSKLIFDNETILTTGTLYKFKTRPIDPSDPFRGKYITLSYDLRQAKTKDTTIYDNDEAFLYFENDSLGYAKVDTISKTELHTDKDYIKLPVSKYYYRNSDVVNFRLPFNRYYMEEFKAKPAEDVYRDFNRRNTENVTYGLVSIKDGQAVLQGVYINDKPIEDYIEGEE